MCTNPDCRRPNRDNAVYCVHCGHKLHEGVNAPARPVRPEAGGKIRRRRDGVIIGLVLAGLIFGLGAGIRSKHRDTVSFGEHLETGYGDMEAAPVLEKGAVPTGAISLESTPKGAKIRLDGKKTSYRTPAILADLTEGEHDVRVEYRRRGVTYYFEDRIAVRGGQTINRMYRFSVGEEPVSDASVPSLSGPNAAGWSRRDLGERVIFTKKGYSFTLVKIPQGEFYMDREGAGVQRVSLGSYAIGETEVTRMLWAMVLGTGSLDGGGSLPMDRVSYGDCVAFITELNRQTGERFRLPTEAEWEYAARGGRGAPDFWYDEPGNNLPDGFGDTGAYSAWQVYAKGPNSLGLFGMSGNVAEWCSDWYGKEKGRKASNPDGPRKGVFRVVRGSDFSQVTRLATYRYPADPSLRSDRVGFRLAI